MANEDTLKSLGHLITAEDAGRDAIHIAVVPMVAAARLAPAQQPVDRSGAQPGEAAPQGGGASNALERRKALVIEKAIALTDHIWITEDGDVSGDEHAEDVMASLVSAIAHYQHEAPEAVSADASEAAPEGDAR